MKIIVNGSNGRMGKAVTELADGGFMNAQTVALVDINNVPSADTPIYEALHDYTGDADCIIDFTHHTVTETLLEYALSRKLPLVIATTAQTEQELAMIKKAAREIPIFLSANMSLGIAVMNEICKTAVRMFPDADVEIVETHHNQKLDVPSGTALILANGIKQVRLHANFNIGRHEDGKRDKKEIGIHSVRMGNVIGVHEVMISTGSQTLTIKHEAASRTLFAEGALTAASFLTKKDAGLYSMTDLIE